MAWLLVVLAGLLETGFAVSLKQSHGFTRLAPTILFAVFAQRYLVSGLSSGAVKG